NAGDLSANARANALRVVNLYRFLAALPEVTTDPTLDASDQQCALMMLANNTLSHTPPTTWTCFTQAGADAAGSSNISSGPAVGSVDSYMIDDGNPTTLGHRRWVLSNSLGPIGIGGTNKASCMHTLNGTGKAGKAWMAWPSAGTIPLQALNGARNQSVDITGWSIQSEKIDLSAAQVTVMMDGAAQPVTVTQLLANYGTKYAIDFIPQGWKTQAGKTYSVSVSGVTPAIAYDVQIVDCK
ncbi:MAG TPA: CAP domain-containing protein, partial [Polyangiaceae bacterium]